MGERQAPSLAERSLKHCPDCCEAGEGKPVEDFNRNRTRGDGRDGVCRECLKSHRKGLTAKNVLKANLVAPDVKPEPSKTPLESAYAIAAAQRHKRDEAAERKALLGEAEGLKKLLAEMELANRPIIPSFVKRSTVKSGDAIACAIASDWHIEEEVNEEEVNGLNRYDLGIAETRSKFFFQNLLKLTEMLARDRNIETIWLGLLGDFITNWLHEDAVAGNLLRPGDAAWQAQSMLIGGIEFLLRESKFKIIGDCITGNHGRTTKKMPSSGATGTSWEVNMYRNIALYFRDNPRVQLNVPSSKMVYRSFFEKFNMRVIHGDSVKFNGGSGGLTIPIKKAINEWNKAIRADLTAMGHFHQRFDGGDFMVNGSLIGYNGFAQDIKASPEEPMQQFFLVDARAGGQKSVVAPIWLDDRHKLTVTES